MERSASTSFSIFPLSSRRFWWTFIQAFWLNGAGKMQAGLIPAPFGAVGYDNFLFRSVPPAIPGFQIKPLPKLFGCLDGARVGGRIGIADGIALFVPLGLREHAAEFDFPRMSRLAVRLAFPSLRLFLHHRHA